MCLCLYRPGHLISSDFTLYFPVFYVSLKFTSYNLTSSDIIIIMAPLKIISYLLGKNWNGTYNFFLGQPDKFHFASKVSLCYLSPTYLQGCPTAHIPRVSTIMVHNVMLDLLVTV